MIQDMSQVIKVPVSGLFALNYAFLISLSSKVGTSHLLSSGHRSRTSFNKSGASGHQLSHSLTSSYRSGGKMRYRVSSLASVVSWMKGQVWCVSIRSLYSPSTDSQLSTGSKKIVFSTNGISICKKSRFQTFQSMPNLFKGFSFTHFLLLTLFFIESRKQLILKKDSFESEKKLLETKVDQVGVSFFTQEEQKSLSGFRFKNPLVSKHFLFAFSMLKMVSLKEGLSIS